MIPWALSLTTAATLEPVTIAEVKGQSRIFTEDEDFWLDTKVVEAVRRVADYASKALMTETWTLKLPSWPASGKIVLPRPPLQSVTSITYLDTDGASQTLSAALYTVNTASEPGTIVPAYGESWPSLRTQDGVHAVTIVYVAGHLIRGDIRLQPARAAIVDLVTLWHQTRGVTPVEDEVAILSRHLDPGFRCYHDFEELSG